VTTGASVAGGGESEGDNRSERGGESEGDNRSERGGENERDDRSEREPDTGDTNDGRESEADRSER